MRGTLGMKNPILILNIQLYSELHQPQLHTRTLNNNWRQHLLDTTASGCAKMI